MDTQPVKSEQLILYLAMRPQGESSVKAKPDGNSSRLINRTFNQGTIDAALHAQRIPFDQIPLRVEDLVNSEILVRNTDGSYSITPLSENYLH